MKISDVIKSQTPNPGGDEPQKKSAAPPPPLPPVNRNKISPFSTLQKRESFVPAQNPTPAIPNPVKSHAAIHATKIYTNLIFQARKILTGFSQSNVQLPDLEEICEAVHNAIVAMQDQPAKLLELADRSTPEDYLPGHLTNVALFSIAMSQDLQWSEEMQAALGVGAMLHDVGMVYHRPTYSKPFPLKAEERQALRRIPEDGIHLLDDFLKKLSPNFKTVVHNVILQFQERVSGQGFPKGLKDDEISKEAQIVGLCDAYESISHERPYRERKLPHATLRYMLELSGEMFDGELIKALWETLSLFPPGSFVKLNTGEIGKIVGTNKKLPTRPVVKIIASPEGKRAAAERIIDLAQVPGVTIEKAVDECALELADKKLMLELRAQKWWMGE